MFLLSPTSCYLLLSFVSILSLMKHQLSLSYLNLFVAVLLFHLSFSFNVFLFSLRVLYFFFHFFPLPVMLCFRFRIPCFLHFSAGALFSFYFFSLFFCFGSSWFVFSFVYSHFFARNFSELSTSSNISSRCR